MLPKNLIALFALAACLRSAKLLLLGCPFITRSKALPEIENEFVFVKHEIANWCIFSSALLMVNYRGNQKKVDATSVLCEKYKAFHIHF